MAKKQTPDLQLFILADSLGPTEFTRKVVETLWKFDLDFDDLETLRLFAESRHRINKSKEITNELEGLSR